MDARNHFAMRARIEMQQGNYQEALRFLSMALNQIPPFLGKVAAPLLADRAECFWQLGHAGKAVQEMMSARDAGLPAYGENSEVTFVFFITGVVASLIERLIARYLENNSDFLNPRFFKIPENSNLFRFIISRKKHGHGPIVDFVSFEDKATTLLSVAQVSPCILTILSVDLKRFCAELYPDTTLETFMEH